MKNLRYTICREFIPEYMLWALWQWRHCDVSCNN